MAPLGIHRTLAKVAAKQRSKAQEGLDFFIALPSIDHLGLDGHSALVSNVARAYRLQALRGSNPGPSPMKLGLAHVAFRGFR